ncbi:hypothetical protein [Belliella aquatica]|uniref:Uncharacterized protein n=1 Tax=Belliella aquatica TaxID=1323734 RepID=A0ABQ1N883_9BACT|nr:hypothetical protein [Belliella aquatica]MCH7407502.1 hypothetical protein [Belliella aquatica]GGC54124.1 hypothetical protein GCM10010993_35650 [Belliella aquatica]
MSNDNFFSKSNIYPTIWAIIVGLLAFISGLFWKGITGPDEVVVLNKGSEKDTTVTIIQFKPDQEYFENLTKMTSKSVKKQFASTQPAQKKEAIDSLTLEIARDYQLKFDSLRLKISENRQPLIDNTITSIPSSETKGNNSKLQRPLFRLPAIVEGYVEGKSNSFATISMNTSEFKRKDKVEISVDFFNNSTLDKITPLFIDIVEPKTENSVYQIWSEQYEIKELRNVISFSADFKRGKYILTIGFYLKDELNQKYPVRYARKYNIEIK